MDSVQDFYMTKNTDIPYRIEAAFKVNGNDYVMCIDRHTTEGIYFCKIAYVTAKQKRFFKYKTPADILPALSTCIKILEASAAFLGPRVAAFCFALPSNTSKNYNRLVTLMLKKTYLKNTYEQLPTSYEGASHKFLLLMKRGKSAKNVFKGKYFKDYNFEWHDKKDEIPAKAIEDLKPFKPEKKMTTLEPSTKYSFDDVSPDSGENDSTGVNNDDIASSNSVDNNLFNNYFKFIKECKNNFKDNNRYYIFMCFTGMWRYENEIKDNPHYSEEAHSDYLINFIYSADLSKIMEFIEKYSYGNSFIKNTMKEAYDLLIKKYPEYNIFIRMTFKEMKKYISDSLSGLPVKKLNDDGYYRQNTAELKNIEATDGTKYIKNNDLPKFTSVYTPVIKILNNANENEALGGLLGIILGSLILVKNEKYDNIENIMKDYSIINNNIKEILSNNFITNIPEYKYYEAKAQIVISSAFIKFKNLNPDISISRDLFLDAVHSYLNNIKIWKYAYNENVSKKIDTGNYSDDNDNDKDKDNDENNNLFEKIDFDTENSIYYRLNGYAKSNEEEDPLEYLSANIAIAFNFEKFRNIKNYKFNISDYNYFAKKAEFDKIVEKLCELRDQHENDKSILNWIFGCNNGLRNVEKTLVARPEKYLGDGNAKSKENILEEIFKRAFDIYKTFYIEKSDRILKNYYKICMSRNFVKSNKPYNVYVNDNFNEKKRFLTIKKLYNSCYNEGADFYIPALIFGISIGWQYENEYECATKNKLPLENQVLEYVPPLEENSYIKYYDEFIRKISDGLNHINPKITEMLPSDAIEKIVNDSDYVIHDWENKLRDDLYKVHKSFYKIYGWFYGMSAAQHVRNDEPAVEEDYTNLSLLKKQKIDIERTDDLSPFKNEVSLLENVQPNLIDIAEPEMSVKRELVSSWMDKDKFDKNIPIRLKNTIKEYTRQVGGLNIFLRYLPENLDSEYLNINIKKIKKIKDFNTIFNTAPIVKKPFIVYRDCGLPNVSPECGVLSDINKNIIDNGIISTTINGKFYFKEELNTRLAILIPAGSKFVVPVFENSEYPEEEEILLPPASILKPVEINVIKSPIHDSVVRQYIKCIYTGSYLNSFVDNYFVKAYNEIDNNKFDYNIDESIKTFKDFITESENEMSIDRLKINNEKWVEPFGDPNKNPVLQDIKDGKLKFEKCLTQEELKAYLANQKDNNV